MGKYDAILKVVLQRWSSVLLREIIEEPVAGWHTIELPQLTVQYADLLVEAASGSIWHIELQSHNDPDMPVRMLEYAARIYRKFKRPPRQAVLYVGSEALRMESGVTSDDLIFRYRLMNSIDLDADLLLSSASVGDNIMAVLTQLRASPGTVRRILEAIGALGRPDREFAFEALLLVSSLRELEETVEREAKTMPVFDDILDHKVLGREFKRGREQGREEGRHDAALNLVRLQINERFGAIPQTAEEKLSAMTSPELEGLALRLIRAATIEELFS